MLTSQQNTIEVKRSELGYLFIYLCIFEVCSEENMLEILTRYEAYNVHAASYTWKFCGTNLDMTRTLEENGVEDEFEKFYELGMNEDDYLPAIHLYFNDDLTEH